MNLRINIIAISLILSACSSNTTTITDVTSGTSPYLIDVSDLSSLTMQPSTKILDFRKEEAYLQGHIHGAINIWRTDIEDTTYAYKGMMASPTQIEQLFSRLGIETTDTLVIYDDNGLCDASRLWWLLQNYNFSAVKLLNGGYSGWVAIGGDTTSETPHITRSNFKLSGSQSLQHVVSKEEVLQAIENNTRVLDTRTDDEYTGKKQKNGAAKAGRIPTSMRIDWAEAINYQGDRRIKSIDDLESIYSKLNISKEDPIIVYCHSGVRSAHTFFVLTELLGYKNVKNYDGSWVEWSHFNNLPFKQDSLTIKN